MEMGPFNHWLVYLLLILAYELLMGYLINFCPHCYFRWNHRPMTMPADMFLLEGEHKAIQVQLVIKLVYASLSYPNEMKYTDWQTDRLAGRTWSMLRYNARFKFMYYVWPAEMHFKNEAPELGPSILTYHGVWQVSVNCKQNSVKGQQQSLLGITW